MKKQNFALYFGNRGFMPAELIEGAREDMVKAVTEAGYDYIIMDKDGGISLTQSGLEIAEKIYARHTLLTTFLTHIGFSAETAAEDACKMEHAISDESFEALKKFMAENL